MDKSEIINLRNKTMISTVVTTSTVSTATATAITGSLTIIGVIVLLALLVQKELFSSSENKQSVRFSQVLNIALPAMLIAFVMIVISKISEIL